MHTQAFELSVPVMIGNVTQDAVSDETRLTQRINLHGICMWAVVAFVVTLVILIVTLFIQTIVRVLKSAVEGLLHHLHDVDRFVLPSNNGPCS